MKKSAKKSKKLSPKALAAKLKKIKLLILDIDGVLTDTRIFWIAGQGWTRFFSVKDGYGIKTLRECGIEIAIISGGKSEDVVKRAEVLKIQHVHLGDENKIVAYEKVLAETGFHDDQVAFIGDELFDIPVLERVGFAATVPHAVDAVKKRVHYVTKEQGGKGAVREICDAIRHAQGIGPYLN